MEESKVALESRYESRLSQLQQLNESHDASGMFESQEAELDKLRTTQVATRVPLNSEYSFEGLFRGLSLFAKGLFWVELSGYWSEMYVSINKSTAIFYGLYSYMTSLMFKTQVEPRATCDWSHCQVLNTLWHHFMVYKGIDHRKLPSICFFTSA